MENTLYNVKDLEFKYTFKYFILFVNFIKKISILKNVKNMLQFEGLKIAFNTDKCTLATYKKKKP